MSEIELDQGEHVIKVCRRTAWKTICFSTGAWLILPVFAIVGSVISMIVAGGLLGSLIALLVLAIAAGVLWADYWTFGRNAVLTITNKRLILDTGILSRRRREVRLTDVTSIEFRQTALQRACECGRIFIGTSGHADFEVKAHGFNQPEDLVSTIRRQRGD